MVKNGGKIHKAKRQQHRKDHFAGAAKAARKLRADVEASEKLEQAELVEARLKETDKMKRAKAEEYVDRILKQDHRLGDVRPADGKHAKPYLVVPAKLLLASKDIDAMSGMEMRGMGKMEMILSRRNQSKIENAPREIDYYIEDERGERLVARVSRGCVPEHYAKCYGILESIHVKLSLGWMKGCMADKSTDVTNSIRHFFKDPEKMKAYGLSEETTVLGVELRNEEGEGTSLVCRYLNKKGKEQTFQISTLLDRQQLDDQFHRRVVEAGLAVEFNKCKPLLKHLEKLYRRAAVDFLERNHGWPRNMAKLYMDACEIITATVKIDEMSKMSIHRDPATPVPAAVFGPGIKGQTESGQWVDRCKGGRLFLLNGLLDISYGPFDATFFDGNEPHGPTSLKPLGEEAGKKNRAPLKRFSLVMFCRFNRGQGENHGNYNGTWRKEWKATIEAIAGVDGGRLLRSGSKAGATRKIAHKYATRSNKKQKFR